MHPAGAANPTQVWSCLKALYKGEKARGTEGGREGKRKGGQAVYCSTAFLWFLFPERTSVNKQADSRENAEGTVSIICRLYSVPTLSSTFSNTEKPRHASQHSSLSHPCHCPGWFLPPTLWLYFYWSPQHVFLIHLFPLSPNEEHPTYFENHHHSYFTLSSKHFWLNVVLKISSVFIIILFSFPSNTIRPNTTLLSYCTKLFILTSVWEMTDRFFKIL